jgi:hypothetical protein
VLTNTTGTCILGTNYNTLLESSLLVPTGAPTTSAVILPSTPSMMPASVTTVAPSLTAVILPSTPSMMPASVTTVAPSLTAVFLPSTPSMMPASVTLIAPTAMPVALPVSLPASPTTLSPTLSPVASTTLMPSSVPILTGYYIQAIYSDAACTAVFYAQANSLNTCFITDDGTYVMNTATSSVFYTFIYSDSGCKNYVKTTSELYTGSCSSMQRGYVSSTGIVPSTTTTATWRYVHPCP